MSPDRTTAYAFSPSPALSHLPRGPDGKREEEKGKYLCYWTMQKDGSWKAIPDMRNTDAK